MCRKVCPPYSMHLWATHSLKLPKKCLGKGNFNLIRPFCDVICDFPDPVFTIGTGGTSTHLVSDSTLLFLFFLSLAVPIYHFSLHTFWIYSYEFTGFRRRARSADRTRRIFSPLEVPMKRYKIKGKAIKLKKRSPSDMSCLKGEKSTLTPEVLLNCELSENLSP
jgi:hypothetical protein